jgi:hypothetical protein
LRFLAHKLELDEKQIGSLAKVLDTLKIERAQVEVGRPPVVVRLRRRAVGGGVRRRQGDDRRRASGR